MRKLDVVHITNFKKEITIKKEKAYHLTEGVYLTKKGEAFKMKLNGDIVVKVIFWNKTQYRINVRGKAAPFHLQMLKVFKPNLYDLYMTGKYKATYLDKNPRNVAIDNISIVMKKKYKDGSKCYIKKPINNIFQDDYSGAQTQAKVMEDIKHQEEVSKYQRQQESLRKKKQQQELDKRNLAKMAAKKKEEESKYSFHIFMHPEGYYAIKVLIDNELKQVAQHHDHKTLHNFGLWCEGTSNTDDISTEGKRISNSLVREMPKLTDPGEAWGRYNESRKYCD